jgi:hypothetical protein
MMTGANLRAVALFLALTACAAAVVVDRGCAAYGDLRTDMPALGDDPVSAWVAKLDSAMTRVCR